jgi:hypothetical protein
MRANPCLRAEVTFLSQTFVDLVRGVLLFAGQMGILGQQLICALPIGTEDRCWLGPSESVGLGWPILNRLIDGFAGMSLLAGDLPLAFAARGE